MRLKIFNVKVNICFLLVTLFFISNGFIVTTGSQILGDVKL